MLNGYKTYIAAALLAAFGVLANQDWTSLLDHPDSAKWVAIGSAILMAVMRAITQATTVKEVKKEPVKPTPDHKKK